MEAPLVHYSPRSWRLYFPPRPCSEHVPCPPLSNIWYTQLSINLDYILIALASPPSAALCSVLCTELDIHGEVTTVGGGIS